jgi:uncharacterized protein YqjF (DUF2071 family)
MAEHQDEAAFPVNAVAENAPIDRLSIRNRPPGWPVMFQTWGKLLFLHWRVPAEQLRPWIPRELEIDTFDGSGWIGVTPFTMWGVRPVCFPPLPMLSRSHELNVRTYVHRNGIPGVWFFSLDASNPLAVMGARWAYHLPYFAARMSLVEDGDSIRFESVRREKGVRSAELRAAWTRGDRLGEAQPGTLDFFLIERYCLYTQHRGRLSRSRIHHLPWPLRQARLTSFFSSMLQAQGLPAPNEPPLLHAQAEPLTVGVWPLERA